jgi:hypothetical protein
MSSVLMLAVEPGTIARYWAIEMIDPYPISG